MFNQRKSIYDLQDSTLQEDEHDQLIQSDSLQNSTFGNGSVNGNPHLIATSSPYYGSYFQSFIQQQHKFIASASFACALFLLFLFICSFVALSFFVIRFTQQLSVITSMHQDLECSWDDIQLRYNSSNYQSDDFNRRLRKEIRDNFVSQFSQQIASTGLVYIEGAKTNPLDFIGDGETRQDRDFMYLSGVFEWMDYVMLLDIASKDFILFVPHIDPSKAIWNFPHIPTLQEIQQQYGATQVYYTEDLLSIINQYQPQNTYILSYQTFPFNSTQTNTTVENTKLSALLNVMRTVKTAKELELIQYAVEVSVRAHTRLMTTVKQGMFENQLMGLFEFISLGCGLKFQAYDPIVASGKDAAILHYIVNDKQIWGRQRGPNQQYLIQDNLVLVDAGAEYLGYASDITRTFPVDGIFTNDQIVIYNIVLKVQKAAIEQIKPGVDYGIISKNAALLMLSELQTAGFVKSGVSVQDMYNAGVNRLFMPHGLGHHIGLDVHDPQTPYPNERFFIPGVLQPNMAITVEPGIYFLMFLFTNAPDTQKQYLIMDKINLYQNFGGVRIEDDILVTATGYQVLSAKLPKELDDMKQLMSQKW